MKEVNYTKIGADDFLVAVEDEIFSKSPDNAKRIAKKIPAQYGERITGVLPAYINKDNWNLARLKVEPLSSLAMTGDVLKFDEKN